MHSSARSQSSHQPICQTRHLGVYRRLKRSMSLVDDPSRDLRADTARADRSPFLSRESFRCWGHHTVGSKQLWRPSFRRLQTRIRATSKLTFPLSRHDVFEKVDSHAVCMRQVRVHVVVKEPIDLAFGAKLGGKLFRQHLFLLCVLHELYRGWN